MLSPKLVGWCLICVRLPFQLAGMSLWCECRHSAWALHGLADSHANDPGIFCVWLSTRSLCFWLRYGKIDGGSPLALYHGVAYQLSLPNWLLLHPLHDGGRAKHTILVVGGVFLAQIQNYGACVYFVGPCYGIGLFCDSYTSRTSSIEFFDLVSNLLEGREPCHLLVGHDHTAITKSFVHLLVCQDSPRHGWCACQRQEGLRWIVGASIYDRFIAWRIDCLRNWLPCRALQLNWSKSWPLIRSNREWNKFEERSWLATETKERSKSSDTRDLVLLEQSPGCRNLLFAITHK